MTESKKRTIPIRNHEPPGSAGWEAESAESEAPGPDSPSAADSRGTKEAPSPTSADTAVQSPTSPEPPLASSDDHRRAPEAPAEEALLAVTAERDEYFDALLRLKAEFENYRKRSQREILETGSRARASLLGEFLPVLDNLRRALDAAEHHEEGKVLDGVRLTHNLFASLLLKEGVTPMEPRGQLFDPEKHDAMLSRPAECEEGIISDVLDEGYMFGDRVLRPAKVVVSSGPPGEAPV
ncbi:MAG: nucleotide exchange factor GrpE [Thermoleophilia bacterium]|nr:nucleotide exchange factor GrpE [Thermoleophilia bacterium]